MRRINPDLFALLASIAGFILTLTDRDEPTAVDLPGATVIQAETTVVVIPNPALARTARLTEVTWVGRGLSGSDYDLTRVGPLSFARDGGVILVHRGGSSYRIAKFDSSGRLVRSFGRNGPGPGEFRAPRQAQELGDGRIVASDRGKLLFYTAEGAYTKAVNVGLATVPFGPPIHVDTSGSIYIEQLPVRSASTARPYLIRIGSDGIVADTIPFPTAALLEQKIGGTLNLPYTPSSLATFSPYGYFVTCVTDRFAINLSPLRTSPSNLTRVTSIRRTQEPVPVSSAERDDWRRSIELFLSVDRPWSWQGPPIPSVKPLIAELRVAADGMLLVRLHQPSTLNTRVNIPDVKPEVVPAPASLAGRRWTERIVYDVISPAGNFIGRLQLPTGMTNFVLKDNAIWGVTLDQDGVPRVSRYRIDW